jgi:hypothetical protein
VTSSSAAILPSRAKLRSMGVDRLRVPPFRHAANLDGWSTTLDDVDVDAVGRIPLEPLDNLGCQPRVGPRVCACLS